MHPVIRIICFVLFTGFLVHPDRAQLLLAFLLILFFLFGHAKTSSVLLLRMLLRLRWFFLSILLVYGWLSPEPTAVIEVSSSASSWFPSTSGLQQGLLRVMSLVLIISAASILLGMTSREQLTAAIYWLSTPLKIFRCSRDKLVLRLMLTLEYSKQLQHQPGFSEDKEPPEKATGIKGRIAQPARLLSVMFRRVIERAETEPVESISIDLLSAPATWQWLYPLLLVGMFLLSSYLSAYTGF